jgi:chromosome segregation ATPase
VPARPDDGTCASVRAMADDSSGEGLRRRLARSSEDALGKLAQDLLENPLVAGALTRAFEAREKAAQAQEVAMGALNLPSAADIERLTRRVRSVSQRLEGIEDGVDRLDESLGSLSANARLDKRLTAIEQRLDTIAADLQALANAKPAARKTTPRKSSAGRSPRAAAAAKPASVEPAAPPPAPEAAASPGAGVTPE